MKLRSAGDFEQESRTQIVMLQCKAHARKQLRYTDLAYMYTSF